MHVRDSVWGPWLALRLVRGVGGSVYRQLLSAFSDPAVVFGLRAEQLAAVGVRPEVARAITAFDRWSLVERQLRCLERCQGRVLTWSDDAYPGRLRQIHDPPPFVYARGVLAPEDELAIAVVGSRSPSSYGREMTRALSAGLARLGVTVVSGLARGIDAEAHHAALRAGGRSLAVLGSGLDVIYPGEHRGLARDLVERGALLTELAPGTAPDAENFPARNRIISGLALGTLVVEATEKSGSLITARMAAEQGREVFAVPGPVGPRSAGPHRLIKQGAKLTERVEDIIEEVAPQLLAQLGSRLEPGVEAPNELEQRLLATLPSEALHIDQIMTLMGWTAPRALEALLSLEIKGLVRQLPGKLFLSLTHGPPRVDG
jgi:DNA processing protein